MEYSLCPQVVRGIQEDRHSNLISGKLIELTSMLTMQQRMTILVPGITAWVCIFWNLFYHKFGHLALLLRCFMLAKLMIAVW